MNDQTLVCYSLLVTATIAGWRCSAVFLFGFLTILTNQSGTAFADIWWWHVLAPVVFSLCLAEVVLDKYSYPSRYRDLFAMFCAPILSVAWCILVGLKIVPLSPITTVILAIACAMASLLSNTGQALIRTWVAGFASAHPRSTHICLSLWTDAIAIILGVLWYLNPELGSILALVAITSSAWAWWCFRRQGLRLMPWLKCRAQGCKVVTLEQICGE